MEKQIFNICLLCCLTIITSCNKTKPEDATDYEYTITLADTLDVPSWDKMVDSVCYIPLKIEDNALMGEIEQFVVKDELIYLLANGIYCFDMSGKCKFKIANRGRARNEFIDPISFSVSDGNVYLYDKMKHKVMIYDALTGKYIEDVDIPIGGRRVYFLGDTFIFDDAQTDVKKYTRFKTYSKNKPDRVQDGYFSNKEFMGSIAGTCLWSNDGVIYSSYLRNLAWKINGNECIPYIKVIVPEKNRLSDKTINRMITDNTIYDSGYNTENAIYGLSYLSECDGFISGQLSYDQSFVFFIYDKETGNSKFFKMYSDPEAWKFFPIGRGSTGDGNCLYSVVTANDAVLTKKILGGTGNEPADERFRQAYDVIDSTEKDDNPIIARFWLSRI